MDSGCGSVGEAVSSNTRCPQFESSHWQNFIQTMHLLLSNGLKDGKKKRLWMARLKNRYIIMN